MGTRGAWSATTIRAVHVVGDERAGGDRSALTVHPVGRLGAIVVGWVKGSIAHGVAGAWARRSAPTDARRGGGQPEATARTVPVDHPEARPHRQPRRRRHRVAPRRPTTSRR